ncbi:hypothetical protein C0J52_22280 [Blattella germanica]|nr:hypothetical protein C0J52_22280 [Blattella germanica]
MAVVLKNTASLFAEEENILRQVLVFLQDEIYGLNVELEERLVQSGLETFLADKILSLPERSIELAYGIFYQLISGHDSKMLVRHKENEKSFIEEIINDALGHSEKDKTKVYKIATDLMLMRKSAKLQEYGISSFKKFLEFFPSSKTAFVVDVPTDIVIAASA